MMDRTETQIMENWSYQEPPLVSIACVTYNHEKYIADAIESFLKQKTNFPFEIIIHDDASTDTTAEIIRNYVKKYPNLIKPIFQKENQFSQPGKNGQVIAISYAKGEYIALCEGDDYWIDAEKLQIQIDEMRKHPECDLSFHPALRRCAQGKKRDKIISKHSSYNKVFSTREAILGAAGFCPTASCIIKKSIFESLPEWFREVPIGDYFLQILGSLKGGLIYIDRVMSVYRVGLSGSWSERMSKDEDYVYDYVVKILKSLQDVNLFTNNKYLHEFNIIIHKVCFSMCRNPVLSFEKRKKIFDNNKSRFNFKNKMLWYLIFRNNQLCKLTYDLRNYILG